MPVLPSSDFLLEFYDKKKKEKQTTLELMLIELIEKKLQKQKKKNTHARTQNDASRGFVVDESIL